MEGSLVGVSSSLAFLGMISEPLGISLIYKPDERSKVVILKILLPGARLIRRLKRLKV